VAEVAVHRNHELVFVRSDERQEPLEAIATRSEVRMTVGGECELLALEGLMQPGRCVRSWNRCIHH
jgi:hypothetical protein